MKTIVFINPSSAGGKALEARQKIESHLSDAGQEYKIHITKSLEDMLETIRAHIPTDYINFIGAGGDGTAHYMVNELADIAITHGGQGTIQTAAWSGTPIVGVGFQSEQQANIDGMVRAGAGVRLHLYRINEMRINRAVNKILQSRYSENAARLRELVRNTNGVKESVRLMEEQI